MNKDMYLVAVTTALLMWLSHLVVGMIPVNEFAGWDGSFYLDYIQALAQGDSIHNDPYRMMRLAAFPHLIALSWFGATRYALIEFQLYANIVILSAAAAVLYDTLRCLGCKRNDAIISILILILSWRFVVTPVFYPVLADHIALAISCLCFYCWARSYQIALYILCALSTWIFPLLFIVPLLLAVIPYNKTDKVELISSSLVKVKKYIFLLLTLVLAVTIAYLTSKVPVIAIVTHGVSQGGQTAWYALLDVARVSFFISCLVLLWVSVHIVTDVNFWLAISWRNVFLCALIIIISVLFAYILFDWRNGFRGPSLIKNIVIQALAAPFKPLVAHFASFGPVFILAIIGFLRWSYRGESKIPRAILIVFAAYLPLTLLGSESRQWIEVLPIAVLIFALSDFSLMQRILCLTTTILLLIPMFYLERGVTHAIESGYGLQHIEWQLYFSREGPWMSLSIYQLGVILILLYGYLHFSFNPSSNK